MSNGDRDRFNFRRRLGIVGTVVLLAFAGLFARFFFLQVVLHQHYQTLAETNRIAIVPFAPNRGVVTDRNGIVLAQSYSGYTLEITPSRVKSLDETIDALTEIVDVQPRDRKRFRKLMEEQPLSPAGSWNRLDFRPLDGFVAAVTSDAVSYLLLSGVCLLSLLALVRYRQTAAPLAAER